ncbi:hypothetical protein [Marinicella litoralis]|uniref:Uncharacterized protein n=1 Tax=Marinicella litoralis TaxID=644220 RepID=A0A4R6XMP3_9GAMM|nr:hypothetical protein [Marinicella litoralis]TDR19370.1 hypothetical protein C8D91_1919 [Marinicella litoralis]
MLAEIWMGELAMKCGHTDLTKQHLISGLEKSKQVYKTGSVGQKQIAQKVSELLNL